jgi:ribulose-phosphate 3-epimerase
MLRAGGYPAEIEVDGGIDEQTAPLAVKAGATVLVAGSAIFDSSDPVRAIAKIKKTIAGGE